jgi:hypothetical protein
VYSERSTRAIGQYHELCSLAALGLTDFRAPFFAATNMPSMKHSFHRTFCRSLSWSDKARHNFNSTPLSAHWHRRRWTADFEPYRCGNSLQGAPVQRIQRMPSKHWRSLTGGLPPFRLDLRVGSCGSISFHCLSDTARQVIIFLCDLVRCSGQITCQPVLG